jgi:hypothetical protein
MSIPSAMIFTAAIEGGGVVDSPIYRIENLSRYPVRVGIDEFRDESNDSIILSDNPMNPNELSLRFQSPDNPGFGTGALKLGAIGETLGQVDSNSSESLKILGTYMGIEEKSLKFVSVFSFHLEF